MEEDAAAEAVQLIDGDGEFVGDAAEQFMAAAGIAGCGLSYAVVSIMGPQSSGKSTLLNQLFGTNFREMDAFRGRSQTTKGIWIARCVGVEPCTVVLDLEGTDGRERGEDDTAFEKQSALFALAISDIVLINMWCHDIGREQAANKPLLKTIFQAKMANYEPKNILITGAAGFIASHVANRLVRNYPHYKVVVLDKLDYCSSLKNLDPSRPSPNFKFVKGDIASADLVNYLLITESIDTIMHFAAQTHVDNSFGNSFEFTKNNIYGTHVLLEACKVTGQIRRFIHFSTDEVYGETYEDAVVGNHEASQLLPTNPYSATKAGAEMLVMAYGRSYGLPVITTRGNNVYGPNQFPEKLIPKFILLAMRGLPLPIHGDGSNVRSYLYCEDVAEAFEVVLHKGEVGHVYNIGTMKERRVIDVARDICKLFGLDTEKVIRFVENRPFNDQRYFLDDQKLKNLGWAERTPWEEGLKKTIEWYTNISDYWGDVSGALLPHPRMLMTPGVERHNWTEEINSLASSPAEAKESGTTAPATIAKSTSSAPQKASYKFLIYGRTGWIGGLLGKICEKQSIPYEYGKGRLEERSQLLQDIRNVKPTHVFNAAGVTGRPNVDWCETHKQDTIRTNVVGTLNLADVCRDQGLLMINYTTGCIFEYDAKHLEGFEIGFKEEDTPNFTGSFYSKTKAMVEELLKEYDNVCTLRVRMPISSDLSNPRNFITKIARYDKVVNIPNSMTILDELLPISVEMAKRDCRGIWNFTNPGVVSHNEILEMYKKYINPDFKWTNFSILME